MAMEDLSHKQGRGNKPGEIRLSVFDYQPVKEGLKTNYLTGLLEIESKRKSSHPAVRLYSLYNEERPVKMQEWLLEFEVVKVSVTVSNTTNYTLTTKKQLVWFSDYLSYGKL